jgi:hypothetical protein
MKITITYEYQPNYPSPYFAATTINGNTIMGCGDTYGEAREKLIRKLLREKQSPPAPEDIDLDIAEV